MQFRSPQALQILIPLVLLALLALRHSAIGLTRRRFWLTVVTRLGLIAALGLILVDARMVLPSNERAVVFVLDASESMAPTSRRHALAWIRRAWDGRESGDRAGMVVFGNRARPEAPLSPGFTPVEPSLEGLPRDSTAIERGLQAAGSLLRGEDSERRVVLLSDGNGDERRTVRQAMALASAGIEVTTVAIEMNPSPREVLIGDVTAPQIVNQDEPFLLKVEVVARTGGPAKLHVVRNGNYLTPQEVELAPGTNRISIPQRLETGDVYVYEVSVEARGDGDPANNVGGAIVRVRGQAKVLLVVGPELDAKDKVIHTPAQVGAPLARALRRAGFNVTVRGPDGLPLGADELAGFSAFLFGNISAERWTPDQMEAVRRYVFDQGGGLVALGGQRSFGMGGYYKTPIETALPVNSDVRGKKTLPSMALVFCIDRSGSMQGEAGPTTKLGLAREGAARSLELLQPFDQLGLITFDTNPEWVIPPTFVDEPQKLKRKIHSIKTGGGTSIVPALRAAHEELVQVKAQIKHVILLTDGRSGESPAEFAAVRQAYLNDKITLTTVGIGRGVDQNLLEDLANGTGGRYLWAPDASTVPRLLTKEAITASRALLVEREVVPRHRGGLSKLAIDWAAAPPLLGFVLTVPKERAEVVLDTGPEDTIEDGPLLVRWRYGLGKAVAFTSDANARWCARWLQWPGFAQVMGATVRWAAREPQAPGFETTLHLEQGLGRVTVQVHAPDGSPINGLDLGANITGPPAAGPAPRLQLAQSGPGSYQAEFEVKRPGAYFTTVDRSDGTEKRPVGSAGAVLAYPREYRHLSGNPALLARVASITRGEALTLDDDAAKVFGGTRTGRVSFRPLAPYLFVAAALLLLFEVVARKLVLPRRTPTEEGAEAAARPPTGSLLNRLRSHKQIQREDAAARRGQSGRTEAVEVAAVAAVATRPELPETAEPTPAEPTPKPAAPKPAAPKPAAPKPKPTPSGEDARKGSSMSKLLDAKRKARGQSGKRGRADEE